MKKYEGLFQIGEVAERYHISRKMILNYEQSGLLKPTWTDPDSGYRYFDSFTIATIGLILDLRRVGMSLPEIRDYLQGKSSAKSKISVLEDQIKAVKIAIRQLEFRETERDCVSPIRELVLPEYTCVCQELVAKDVDDAIDSFLGAYDDCLSRGYHFQNGNFHFCEFLTDIFDDNFYQTEQIKMKTCISVDQEETLDQLTVYPATRAVMASFCGSYGKSVIAYEALRQYIMGQGLTVTGYPREYYLEGNFDHDYDKNIVCIAIPVA